jgi:hypothetical protein
VAPTSSLCRAATGRGPGAAVSSRHTAHRRRIRGGGAGGVRTGRVWPVPAEGGGVGVGQSHHGQRQSVAVSLGQTPVCARPNKTDDADGGAGPASRPASATASRTGAPSGACVGVQPRRWCTLRARFRIKL